MGSFTGFATLVTQEFFRFWRLIRQTIFPPILTTLLFILIFGFSLGERIQEIHGFPYILYIIPGLAAMGVMNNAFSNTSTSLYMARFDQSLDNILAAPLKPIEIVTALVVGGIARGILIGGITLAVSLLLLKQPLFSWPVTFFFLIQQSILFGCWGIIGALRAKTWDSLATTQTFVITPLVYLGGVFYSINLLPDIWKKISIVNPLFYMVDGIRYGVLGILEVPLWHSVALSGLLTLLLFALCVYLFQIGYKLVR
ncbi:MAG: hypothetical protein A2W61_06420 [Deltaproteobacteria bacterium RIFCSPLOWO2_01_44_7]|nr:MAG: hypothetical protein A2712_06205 [Deltaproteobacteria bacterium RIFCSPHIGHO2_01_FULL_43_49]OGQ16720.1 MAG: hypothetical protein A3D22_07330 [Deltaproteobacteria bacterium RIFCSPHIGHO2_02_FULL_44_53]OGQ29858.1 MAG: hypothetical protein A3D98_09995 [Deltaproteobacteria bacterium RIFCSPHIGHO2_12_FULL_44_21]OGQ33148.1 MAG: hypothetical protein A2979_03975 [Deltaproteobacteria bacterium RIFCSPLOWO2_01_FULL_45_74]OGQ42243.1 MAG: hypothetical protein A3I70_06280 [Deltaproteobacteria bacterium 